MTTALSLLVTYGPWLLLLFTLLGAFGLPAPASLSLIAAGAFSRAGLMAMPAVLAAGLVGTVTGDHLAYQVGRGAGSLMTRWRDGPAMARARRGLERWGMVHIFFSRFVFPTVLTPATNYLTGLTRYPLARFTPAVVAGEAVYVGLYVALGWTFSAQIAQVNSAALYTSLLVVIVILAIYFLRLILQGMRR